MAQKDLLENWLHPRPSVRRPEIRSSRHEPRCSLTIQLFSTYKFPCKLANSATTVMYRCSDLWLRQNRIFFTIVRLYIDGIDLLCATESSEIGSNLSADRSCRYLRLDHARKRSRAKWAMSLWTLEWLNRVSKMRSSISATGIEKFPWSLLAARIQWQWSGLRTIWLLRICS